MKSCCPAPAPSLGAHEHESDQQLAALAKALGHPLRVQIVRMLARTDRCMCGDLVDQLPLAQSTVSQHLKVLKEAGLVRAEVDGTRVCYWVDPDGLRRLRVLMAEL
jgi:ArsR family transcriptional regulator, arsenate/arsenite/antimonite-responsive transcriptional repressor